MGKANWDERKHDERVAKNTDQTEFLAVKYGTAALEEGIRDDRTADAMDDSGGLDSANAADWAVEDIKVDDAGGAIADEIERRGQLMGKFYPFRRDGNKLSHFPSNTLAYELCLAISMAPTITAKPFNSLPPAFERLCRDAVGCYLGEGSESLRTGWPIDGNKARDAKFKSVVDIVNSKTREWVWRPAPGMPTDPSHQDVKDLGIDFAVWKQMPDTRRGMLFLLGQCACGDDWSTKFNDLNIESIGKDWFGGYLSVANPMRLFLVPHQIPNISYFEQINRNAGLAFDRARIIMIAEREENREKIVCGATKPIADLVKLVVDGFEVAPPVRARQRRKGAAARRSR